MLKNKRYIMLDPSSVREMSTVKLPVFKKYLI